MVAVINVNAYPFLVSSELTCHLEDRGIGFFPGCIVLSDS